MRTLLPLLLSLLAALFSLSAALDGSAEKAQENGEASEGFQLTPDTFDQIVGHDTAALVKFYAPWCGHCRQMAKDFARAEQAFSHARKDVVLASVDADHFRSLGERFKVGGYPTLYWFPKGRSEPEEYNSGRDFDSIIGFVERKTGIRATYKSLPTAKDTTGAEFTDFLADRNAHGFVMFYAPCITASFSNGIIGCGHCKKFKPTYAKVQQIFENEPDCKVMLVNGDVERDLVRKYDIPGYPTLKFFHASGKDSPLDYPGMRDLDDVVNYLNEQCGTFRRTDGKLMPEAGVRRDVEAKLGKLLSSNAKESSIESALVKEFGSHDKNVAYYGKIADLHVNDSTYLGRELARISRLLKKGDDAMTRQSLDSFTIRRNILNRVLALISNNNEPSEDGGDL